MDTSTRCPDPSDPATLVAAEYARPPSPPQELIEEPPVRAQQLVPAQSVPSELGHSSNHSISLNDTVRQWVSHRGLVVLLLLTCGPMGLPALWFSPRFSNTTKAVTTIALLLLTFLIPIAITWYWLDIAIRPVLDALELPAK